MIGVIELTGGRLIGVWEADAGDVGRTVFCYDTAGRSVLDVSGAVVGPLTRAGPEKGH